MFLYGAYFGFLAYLRCFTENLLKSDDTFFFSQCAYSLQAEQTSIAGKCKGQMT